MQTAASEASSSLAATLRPSFGPLGGDVLILTTSGKAVLTCSGGSAVTALAATVKAPLERWLLAAVERHAATHGDGTTALVLMLEGAMAEVLRQTARAGAEGSPRQRALRQKLAHALQLVPRWFERAVVPVVAVPGVAAPGIAGGSGSGSGGAPLTWGLVRSVLSTAIGRSLGSVAGGRVAGLLVAWLAACSGEASGNSNAEGGGSGGGGGEGPASGQPAAIAPVREGLLHATVRGLRAQADVMVLTGAGASLSASRVLARGELLLPRPLVAKHVLGRSALHRGRRRFVVVQGSLEPLAPAPGSGAAAATVTVGSAPAFAAAVSYRPQRLRLAIGALKRAGVGLLLSSEALLDPIPQVGGWWLVVGGWWLVVGSIHCDNFLQLSTMSHYS